MGVKLSGYIKNPKEAITEDEWKLIYKHFIVDNEGDFDDLKELIEIVKNNEDKFQ